MADRVQRGLGGKIFIVGISIDDLDVLVHAPGIIFQRCKWRNQRPPERRNLALALFPGDICSTEKRNSLKIEIAQSGIVSAVQVGIGHGRCIFVVMRRLLQESAQQLARRLELPGIGHFAGGFVGKLGRKLVMRVPGRLHQ